MTNKKKNFTFVITSEFDEEFKFCMASFARGTMEEWLDWLNDFRRLSKLKRWAYKIQVNKLGYLLQDELFTRYEES